MVTDPTTSRAINPGVSNRREYGREEGGARGIPLSFPLAKLITSSSTTNRTRRIMPHDFCRPCRPLPFLASIVSCSSQEGLSRSRASLAHTTPKPRRRSTGRAKEKIKEKLTRRTHSFGGAPLPSQGRPIIIRAKTISGSLPIDLF